MGLSLVLAVLLYVVHVYGNRVRELIRSQRKIPEYKQSVMVDVLKQFSGRKVGVFTSELGAEKDTGEREVYANDSIEVFQSSEWVPVYKKIQVQLPHAGVVFVRESSQPASQPDFKPLKQVFERAGIDYREFTTTDLSFHPPGSISASDPLIFIGSLE